MKRSTLIAVFALIPAGAFAANVTITASSTDSAGVGVTTYSAPNATWSISFQVASTPSVSSSNGFSFTTTYTNGVFMLNSTPVTLTGGTVTFTNGGAFTINLDSSTTLQTFTDGFTNAMFSGSPSSPTMTSGTYPQTGYDFVQNLLSIASADNSFNTVITGGSSSPTPPPTPAPSGFLLASIGLIAVAVFAMFYRKRPAA